MATVAFTSLAELRDMISPARATELFDDDADGVIDESDTAVAMALSSANDAVVSILYLKGFSPDQLTSLAVDESIRRYATALFAQYGGERRTEFLDPAGNGRYHAIGERARKDLAAFATGQLRSHREQETGANPIVGGEASAGCPPFLIARDPRLPGSRGPGGF